jgi:hypothetical protein
MTNLENAWKQERPLHFTILHRQLPHGWSQFVVVLGSQVMYRMPSYLSHALGDIARAAVQLARGEESVRFSFQDEPGEYRWILSLLGQGEDGYDRLKVTILDFDDVFSPQPDSEGKVLIDGICSKWQFLLNVRSILRETLAANGTEGYKAKTIDYEFPDAELRELEDLTKHIAD